MSSREKILAAIKSNQPDQRPLPSLTPPAGGIDLHGGSAGPGTTTDLARRFIDVLEAIGGRAYIVSGKTRIAMILKEEFKEDHRIVNGVAGLTSMGEAAGTNTDPHGLENVDLAILEAFFGVAENGACWITEEQMKVRALPFIAQHLALVIHKKDIVANMHEAYDRIAGSAYGFGTFIAGPSKTADIEQSLVLGAHGPRSMTVFLIDEELSDAGFY